MIVFHLTSFDELTSLPLSAVSKDWFHETINPPPSYAFGVDATHLHFRATRHAPSTVHPSALHGRFQAELWKYDVAEFFLQNPNTGTYLEINLSPNGAWWSCLFTAPRRRLTEQEEPIPKVTATASHHALAWDAQISIPLSFLRKTLDFGPSSQLHAAFLLDSPQRCLTSGTPPPGDPDFHHPDLPTPITFAERPN